MESEHVKVKIQGNIMELTLDRPKANTINLETSKLMGKFFESFRDDNNLHVAIVRTAGEKFFSAGFDLKEAASGESPVDGDYGVGGFAGLQEIRDLNKPVIIAVEGMAVGGGFELSLAGDLIYATRASSFCLPEIKAGTIADAASCKLPKRIPYHVAMDMLLTGRWMSAEEAHKWGLVNELFETAEELYEHVWKTAQLLADGPQMVFASIKEVVRMAEAEKFQDMMNKITKRKVPTVDKLYGSFDNLEGFKAFAEKRDPNWKGK